MNDLEKVQADLEELWKNYRAEPEYMQIELSQLRKMVRVGRPDVIKFLEETKDVQGDAIAVLTPKSVTLLVDEDGNLLAFK